MTHELNELALFAGGGGGILGGKLLGWRCVCAVEVNDYARRILMARQDDGSLPPFPIWDDVRTFDGRPWRGVVDIISGGFPCQDISCANSKGEGIHGERSGLWREMARIIGEVRPRLVLVENSPMLVGRGLGLVLGDLAAMGYDARWGVVGAWHAGAPHKRDRLWLVAYPECPERWEAGAEGCGHQGWQHADGLPQREEVPSRAGAGGAMVSDAPQHGRRPGRQGRPAGDGEEQTEQPLQNVANAQNAEPIGRRDRAGRGQRSQLHDDGAGAEGTLWWESEPDVGRVAHGVAARVDRLRALGNGQVPAALALAWNLLAPEQPERFAEE